MTNNFSIIFVSLVGLISSQVTKSAAENYNYCDPKLKLCDEAVDHVMCKYPVSGLSSRCTPDVYEPLQATEKQRILILHNKFRSMIAVNSEELPSASNMRELYWDRELELLAERWAQQCVSSTASKVYDECRNIKRFQVSQNVGTRRVFGTTIDKQAPQTVVAWFKENKGFLPAYVDEFPAATEDALKQFANMIWADAYAIGCARTIFQENLTRIVNGTKKNNMWTVERLICNYGPSENMVGKPLYVKGSPCENCPKGTECSQIIPGLCSIQMTELVGLRTNLENEKKQEPSEEPHISAEDRSYNSKNNKGGVMTNVQTNPSNLGSVNEIQQSGKMGKGGRYLFKKGIYVNGRCSLLRYTEVEGMSEGNPERVFIDLENRKSTEQCVVIVMHKKKGTTDNVHFEPQKWTQEETKKTELDVSTPATPANGEPCVCYIPKKRKYGEHSSATRAGARLFLFCAAGLLLL